MKTIKIRLIYILEKEKGIYSSITLKIIKKKLQVIFEE